MLKLAKLAPLQRRIGVLLGGIGVAGLLGGIGVAGLLAGALPAVGAGSAATVQIANFHFAPADLTLAAGTTVIWKNGDDSPHRVADINGAYASAALDARTASRTPSRPRVSTDISAQFIPT